MGGRWEGGDRKLAIEHLVGGVIEKWPRLLKGVTTKVCKLLLEKSLSDVGKKCITNEGLFPNWCGCGVRGRERVKGGCTAVASRDSVTEGLGSLEEVVQLQER